jgi:hypothetical protein
LNADDPSSSEPSDEELERVRKALDEDADVAESDLSEQERELLSSLEERVQAPDVDEDDATGASHREEEEAVEPITGASEGEEGSSDVETTEEAVEPLHAAVDAPDHGTEASEEPVDEEPEEAPATEAEPAEEEAGDEEAADPLSEQAEQALEAANRRQDLGTERGRSRPANGDAGIGGLNPFTVVAPPQGSIQGSWVVEGHEEETGLSSGGGIGLEEDEDLEDPWPGEEEGEAEDEAVPDWPDEEEEELGDEDEAEPWPDQDEWDEAEDEEEALEAEAEPEQDEAWEDEEEEFWEDLLEDEEEAEPEPEDEEPIFEDADDWLEEEEEPATEGERAREEREAWIEESLEEEPAEEDEVEFSLSEGDDEPEDDEDEVEFSLSDGDDNPSSQTLGAEAMAADAEEDEPPDAEHEHAYTHGPYTLYQKTVESSDGETEDLFFFARDPPDDAEPAELPDGHEVGVNERTGVPFVRETDDED